MKTTRCLVLFVVTASLTILSARAQFAYSFVTSVGSGSFMLNTNNLVFTGSDGNAAAYTDTLDSLTFNGITYTNLTFRIFNNSFTVAGGNDGFQILVDKSPYSSESRLELDVTGDSSVLSGVSVSDLVTALSSFNLLKSNSFSSLALYNDPNTPYYQESGSVDSFQSVSPFTINACGIQTNQFGFNIVGGANSTVIIEACTNMANPMWVPIQTNVLTSSSYYFSDSGWTNYVNRFYRIRPQ
jgi:hypothetical protein